MTGFETIKRRIQTLNRGFSAAGMLLIFPMMLLTTADVAGRSIWHRPIAGTYELSGYFLSVFILLGIAYTYQAGGHVRITFFVSRLPGRLAAAVDVFTTLLCLFVVAVLAWQGWELGWSETAVSEQLRIPLMPFRLLVPLAAVCIGLELLIDLAASFHRLLKGYPQWSR